MVRLTARERKVDCDWEVLLFVGYRIVSPLTSWLQAREPRYFTHPQACGGSFVYLTGLTGRIYSVSEPRHMHPHKVQKHFPTHAHAHTYTHTHAHTHS